MPKVTYKNDVGAVEFLVLHVALRLHPRLEGQRNDQDDPEEQGGEHRLQRWPLGIDESPGYVVVQGLIRSVEAMPGQQDGQEGWRVEHQRGHRVQDVGVRHDEELSPDSPAHEHEQRQAGSKTKQLFDP